MFQLLLDAPQPLNQEAMCWIQGVEDFHQKEGLDGLKLEIILAEEAALAEVIGEITRQQGRILSLQKHEPTLEDVFVKLVGQRMEEVENAGATPAAK